MRLFFVLSLLLIQSVKAMVTDGVHTQQEYKAFACSRPIFQTACLVQNSQSLIMQTGVLVAPQIVATAAHGVQKMVTSKDFQRGAVTTLIPLQNTKVTFVVNGVSSTYDVESVIVESRYVTGFLGQEAKYDMAFLKLSKPVIGITPAPLFKEASVTARDSLYVVTFGNADQPYKRAQKRAFMLFELDHFFANGRDPEALELSRSVLLSSLFFKPDENLKSVSVADDDIKQRVFEATQNWQKKGKKPYALVLPGTSGAPVFVTVCENGVEKDYLFGLISSFSHVSGVFQAPRGTPELEYILSQSPDKIMNAYQSIMVLFYQERGADAYHLDPTYQNLILQEVITENNRVKN